MRVMLAGVMMAMAIPQVAAMAQGAQAVPAAPFESRRMIVTVEGQGPDVILVPGLTSNPRIYRAMIAAVPGYRYHLVQVRGFSGTAADANAQGPVLAALADELARYVRERGLARPALIGHSMGGTLGMMVAARHPQALGRLMIVDMAPFTGAFFGAKDAAGAKAMFDAQRQQMAAAGPEAMSRMMTQMIAGMVNTESERPAVLNDSRTSDGPMVARTFAEISTTDLRDELKSVSIPTTVLYVKPAAAPLTEAQMDAVYQAQYANLRGVRLQRVPDAAHFIMLDQPVAFADAVRAFLR